MPLGPRPQPALAASAVTLALLPATALGQGAGDDQYSDPFGSETGEQPRPTATPRALAATLTAAPAQPAATLGRPAPAATASPAGSTLPYTDREDLAGGRRWSAPAGRRPRAPHTPS